MVLGDNPDGLVLKAESANLWHRRMGHIKGKSVDVLRKEPGNGVDYTGEVKGCDSCPLGKSTQEPHPKQATYGVLRPFRLTTVDTLGPYLKHWAVSGTPPSSLTRRRCGRRSTS